MLREVDSPKVTELGKWRSWDVAWLNWAAILLPGI